MKITDINPNSLKKINNKELINMHRRCHQLHTIYRRGQWKDKASMIEKAHHDIVMEMDRRGMNHNSPLKHLHEGIEGYI
jgi:hypothetical protein